jgi:hypothetical protein
VIVCRMMMGVGDCTLRVQAQCLAQPWPMFLWDCSERDQIVEMVPWQKVEIGS